MKHTIESIESFFKQKKITISQVNDLLLSVSRECKEKKLRDSLNKLIHSKLKTIPPPNTNSQIADSSKRKRKKVEAYSRNEKTMEKISPPLDPQLTEAMIRNQENMAAIQRGKYAATSTGSSIRTLRG